MILLSLLIVIFLSLIVIINAIIPSQKVVDRNGTTFEIPSFEWNDLLDEIPSLKSNRSYSNYHNSTLASKIVSKPVYVSMTTTHIRITQVHIAIKTIFKSIVIPDRLYLFISKDPFLVDKGIQPNDIPEQLKQLLRNGYPISIIYTKNIGPHRKLLPLLASKYTEDCIIVTFDDENKSREELKWYLPSLLKYYGVSDKASIVALRSRRIGYCDTNPYQTLSYNLWNTFPRQSIEMLLLPTGTASIMYKPSLLHPIIFSPALRDVTVTADDIAFRLSSMAYNIPVVSGCKTSNFSSNIIFGSKCMYKKRKSSGGVTNSKRKLQTDEIFDDYYNDETLYNYYDDEMSEVSDESLFDEDEDEAESERKLLVHQRDDPNSLYLRFNIKQGNDKQWSAAIALLQKLKVFNMQSIVESRIKIERSLCFQQDNVTNEYFHRYFSYSIIIIITNYSKIIQEKRMVGMLIKNMQNEFIDKMLSLQ